ncbi:conjugative transposon protein TraM [Pedobacter sp. GR22-6]|uniref:conjugative transposon protein TraM n=1 Tax=Pedobacter sp. GR22-6 TaxID=3127957 RepID=UPI00307DD835
MNRQRIERRRMLLLLPLLIVPLLAFSFHLLGGGSGTADQENSSAKGINTVLPDAQFKNESPVDKMDIYNQADKQKSDSGGLSGIADKLGFSITDDPQTAQINEKLAAINREINAPYVAPKPRLETFNSTSGTDHNMSRDVAKLEALMKSMKSETEEPEMAQLSGILQQIQEIQNPKLVSTAAPEKEVVIPDSLFKAIPAAIANSQKVVQGSVVELRLLDTLAVSGQVIPKGHPVFGIAEFSNQRLNLVIRNIRLGTSIIPVNLTVFDKRDAMSGINAPEALLQEAISGGTSGALSNIGLTGFDLTTQVAGAGISAAKSLLSKKIRRLKQKLTAGYPVLLRDNTKKQK